MTPRDDHRPSSGPGAAFRPDRTRHGLPDALAMPPQDEVVRFYDSYHEQCNGTIFGKHSFFMNYGYRANAEREHASVSLPERMINKHSVKLVVELFGERDLSGVDLLDVGCGRGGTIHVARKFYAPRSTTGVDLSSGGVAFCKAAHRHERTWFANADAQALPFAAETFGVVTNVESSHTYSDPLAFYEGVFRVLTDGGWFLYTDLIHTNRLDGYRRRLQGLGFAIELDRDITANVLLSCDETAGAQFEAFGRDPHDEYMASALAVPGSISYELMKNGTVAYRILHLRKPG